MAGIAWTSGTATPAAGSTATAATAAAVTAAARTTATAIATAAAAPAARAARRSARLVPVLAAGLVGVLAGPPAGATVYKCLGEQGIVIYQELPCLIGRELRNFDADPPDLSIIQGGLGRPVATPAGTPTTPTPTTSAAPSASASAPPAAPVAPALTGPATPAAAMPAARAARAHAADAALGRAGGDPAARKFIRQGMSEAEVIARIGRPDATAGGGKAAAARWSYLPAPDDPDTVTTITFIGGIVSDVSRKVIRR